MLQSAILRSRWCTLDKIRSQLPVLLRLIVRRRWSACHSGLEMGDQQHRALEEYISALPRDLHQRRRNSLTRTRRHRGVRRFDGQRISGLDSTKVLELNRDGQSMFVKFDYVICIRPLEAVTVSFTSHQFFEFDQALKVSARGRYPLMSVMELPDFLLEGVQLSSLPVGAKAEEYEAFPEERLGLLETLCTSGGLLSSNGALIPQSHVDHLVVSRDAVNRGIHAAIVTRNARALSLLLRLDESISRSCHQRRQGKSDYDEGEANQLGNGKSFRAGYIIPGEHFRTAIRTSRYKDEPAPTITFFRLLLHASAESLPFNDREVVQFAMDVGGVFGRWLLDLMIRLPQLVRRQRSSEYPWRHSLFILGRPVTDTNIMKRYVDEVVVHGDDCVCPKGARGVMNKAYMTMARWLLTAKDMTTPKPRFN